jgi:ketosteroid isomerase-like protein
LSKSAGDPLISGNLAAVRLVWHLTTRQTGLPEVDTTGASLDLFRREPDGSWRIIRFLAYEAPAP